MASRKWVCSESYMTRPTPLLIGLQSDVPRRPERQSSTGTKADERSGAKQRSRAQRAARVSSRAYLDKSSSAAGGRLPIKTGLRRDNDRGWSDSPGLSAKDDGPIGWLRLKPGEYAWLYFFCGPGETIQISKRQELGTGAVETGPKRVLGYVPNNPWVR